MNSENEITYQNYIAWWCILKCFDLKKARKDKKTSFLKETVENADLD